MQQIGMVTFSDRVSLQGGIAVVRADVGQVALALSLEEDGDLEVIVDVAAAARLVEVLQHALRCASGEPDVP